MEDADELAAGKLVSVEEPGPPTGDDYTSVVMDNTKAMLACP